MARLMRGPNRILGRRRGRLEVILDILNYCSIKPGLPITRICSNTNLSHSSVKDILAYLIDRDMIQVVTLPYSFTDIDRETDYYMITEDSRI